MPVTPNMVKDHDWREDPHHTHPHEAVEDKFARSIDPDFESAAGCFSALSCSSVYVMALAGLISLINIALSSRRRSS